MDLWNSQERNSLVEDGMYERMCVCVWYMSVYVWVWCVGVRVCV